MVSRGTAGGAAHRGASLPLRQWPPNVSIRKQICSAWLKMLVLGLTPAPRSSQSAHLGEPQNSIFKSTAVPVEEGTSSADLQETLFILNFQLY